MQWDIGTILRHLLDQTPITEQRLGELIGRSQAQVWRIANGRSQCHDIRVIKAISDVLGCPPLLLGLAPEDARTTIAPAVSAEIQQVRTSGPVSSSAGSPALHPDRLHSPGSMSGRDDEDPHLRLLLYDMLTGAAPDAPGHLLAEAERLRQKMDRTLASATVTEEQMDRLDETILRYRREYIATPPLPMLCQLMLEFVEVRQLAAHRQPGPIQRRLSHITATLAVLSADALMKLGDIRQARAWYGTARTAADDTGDPRLRALVRAQEAMLPYYYGDLTETVRLAQEAQAIARGSASSPTALAAAAEGRALARLGEHGKAAEALAQAQRVFSRLNSRAAGSMAFEFTEQRLYLYLSGAYAHLPDPRQAETVQQQALALCSPRIVGIDAALVQFDRATTMAHCGQESDACELAVQTLDGLPHEHRTSIVFVRARDVRRALPAAYPAARALRGLDEALALAAATPLPPRTDGPLHG